jgi:hypothetical protein
VTLAIDATSPAVSGATASQSVSATVTGAPANSLLVLSWCGNSGTAETPSAPTITDNLGSHLIYALAGWASRATAPAQDGQAALWTAPMPAGGTVTVTVTNGSTQFGNALKIWVLTGADLASPQGAPGPGAGAGGSTVSQSYTAQRTAGWGFIGVMDWNQQGPETAGSGCTMDASANLGSGLMTYAYARRTTADDVAGNSNTLSTSLPVSSANLHWAYVEIQPALDGGGAPPQQIPPPLLFELIAQAQQLWGIPQTGTPTSAESGAATLGLAAAGSATKVGVSTGPTTLGLAASGTAVHVGKPVGTATLGLAGAGTAKKVVALAGTCALGLTGSGAAAKKAPQAGPAALGLAGAAADRKVAVERGTAPLGLATVGAGAKRAPQAGLATVGFAGTRTSGPPVRAVAGAGYLGLAASGVAARIARAAGAATVGLAGSVGQRKTARPAGTAALGVSGSGTQRHVGKPAGTTTLGLAAAGAAVKRAVSRGLAVLGFAAAGSATRGSGQVEAGALAVTGDSLAASVRGDPLGHTAAGDPLHSAVTGDTTAQTVTGDRLRPTVT